MSRVCGARDKCRLNFCRTRPKMENTTCPTSVLENVSAPGLMLLLASLIAGGIVLVICYAVSRRSRSRQDSQKSKHPSSHRQSPFLPRSLRAARTRTHAYTHVRTHVRTYARTSARMNTTLGAYQEKTGVLLMLHTGGAPHDTLRMISRPRFFFHVRAARFRANFDASFWSIVVLEQIR